MSAIEFFEQPQGTPSQTTFTPAYGYCTPSDVASLNKPRAAAIGVGGNPTLTDIQGYIVMTAGEIDAILTSKGYQVPVNSASSPAAGALLNSLNAKGAYALMEEASPNSPNLDRARQAWEAAMKMLSDANFTLDAAMNLERSEPRGPWVTTQPSGRTYDPMFGGRCNRQDPYFSRSQRY